MHTSFKILFITFLLVICTHPAFSQEKKVISVTSHDKALMITDPERGWNTDTRWTQFPAKDTPYRKIIAYITLSCPEGKDCGHWDYLDYVVVRRQGSVNNPPLDMEIVRILTPYGAGLDSTWQFTWKQDVTDWGYLLRDSVLIEYRHTGYENTNWGWLVTVRFEITTGTPVMDFVEMQKLWNLDDASFAYGNSEKPFDSAVTPKTLKTPTEANMINLRIMQTGHGCDEPDCCSEFCDKWREIFVDQKEIDHKQMFILCGNNPLFPQSGTWIYSRGNWCPGSLSIPDIYTIPAKQPQQTFDLRMQSYTATKPQGGWNINAYAFYYKTPNQKIDVGMEDILAPSSFDSYSRFNPVCGNPHIKIKNNGSEALTKVTIEYGIQGMKKQVYTWKGHLKFMEITDIMLPPLQAYSSENGIFEVVLKQPNGKKDAYAEDNMMQSAWQPAPVYTEEIIVEFKTNKDSTGTSWFLYDISGKTIAQREADSTLRASTIYRDTLHLPKNNCYQLQVLDNKNDGLNFWAHEKESGYGYIRLLDTNRRVLKYFNSDFGTSIIHSFTTNEEHTQYAKSFARSAQFAVTDNAFIDLVLDKPQTVTVNIRDLKGNILLENRVHHCQTQILPVNVSFLSEGLYQIEVFTEEGKIYGYYIRRNP